MDKICITVKDCVKWIEGGRPPRILFAGMSPMLRFNNPPAPHIEITFMEKGSVESLRVGDGMFNLPEGWVSLHGIHFGNYSPPKAERGRAWCLMLDASCAPGFMSYFQQQPVFSAAEAVMPGDLVESFVRVRRLCIGQNTFPRGYDASRAMFDPDSEDCSDGSVLRMKGALLNLFGVLLGCMPDDERKPVLARPEPVENAIRLIEADYTGKEMNLEWLAAKACLSPDHFGRVFKQYVGLSPMAYMQSLRMREAAVLLRNTGERIEKISRTVGYEDPLYFSRLFRKEFKVSPRKFRKG